MTADQNADLKRRYFLRSGVTGAAALGAVGGVQAATSPASKGKMPRWDMDADVVCVGSGAAACSAAVTSVDLGNRVILLEKASVFGGTTRRSGGVAWVPNNFVLQAKGIADTEDDCLRYMCRYAYADRYRADHPTLGLDAGDFELLRAFYRNAAPAVARLNELGAAHFIPFELPGGFGPAPDYAARLPENKVPKGRGIWPDPKITGGRGSSLVDTMISWLQQRGAKAFTGHRVTRLIQNEGRVVGVQVQVQAEGKLLHIRARKGVIFGTGGFAHNSELIRRYQDPSYASCAAPGATGDFIEIASAVGAKMGNLGTAWRNQVVLEEALDNQVVGRTMNIPPGDAMILVNKYGRRVVNEKRNYNDRGRVHAVWDPSKVEFPNQFLFMLFDQRAIDVYGGRYPFPQDARESPQLIKAATWPELAVAIQARLDKLRGKIGDVRLADDFLRNLNGTIERFSAGAKLGKDDEFNRGNDPAETEWLGYFSLPRVGKEAAVQGMPNRTLHPFAEQGPYYALIIAPAVLDTSAGPQVNAQAQVLAANGQPIPGLFGAGNCIASPTRAAYFGGGGTIGPALAFGFIAAHAAHGARAQ